MVRYASIKLLAWPCVLIAAYGVYQLCYARAEAAKTPETALARFENSTDALASQNRLMLNSETLDEKSYQQIASNAAHMLQRAPLDERALVQLALSDFKLNERFTRPELLDLAKARSARNIPLIRSRLRVATLSGQAENTVEEIDLLWRINPTAHDEYTKLLVALYQEPLFRTAINAELSRTPKWGYSMFSALLDNEDTEPYFKDLIQHVIIYRNGLTDPRLIRNLMNQMLTRLMQSKDFKSAYALWQDVFAEDEIALRRSDNLFFAPMFQDSGASTPFNWHYIRNERVNVEPESAQGGIFIMSSGSASELVLRQILPRGNASHLLFKVQGIREYTDRQGHFVWQFFCARSKAPLGLLKLDDDWDPQSEITLRLTPQEENCEFIDVRLSAIPGVYKNHISLIMSEVSLTPTDPATEAP